MGRRFGAAIGRAGWSWLPVSRGSRIVVALLAMLVGGCGARLGPAPVYVPGEPAPAGFYRIHAGDTLSDIAVREGIDTKTLVQWNDLEPPYEILAGGLLRIAPPARPRPSVEPITPSVGRSTPSERPVPTVSSIIGGGAQQAPEPPKPKAATRRAPNRAAEPSARPAVDSGIDWQWPIVGRVVRTFDAGDRTRQGIRIAARPGQIVAAAATGTIGYSGGGLTGYGNLIIIKHKNKYLSAYAFNRRLLVTKGEKVTRGQPIAEVGQTTGGETQLHFEIRKDGAAVDPLQFLPRRH
ncbi:membrane-bound metallopeptidase [Thioflavicoccus mobilis 8321]|uniref:Membrane-bound metallopeptidase n=1 Tax=Thioflavicoccus mobilis 8321 TaxID=765912 RepID=L0GWC3_9GAMM|nr:peptidoglycan DD-metalloendopeptidase family protein [Thioflavicoccus mobilis]AGA90127.1 membrane-bound metallopeptidase [Thioflavicoccus mobilis 8321]